MLSLQWLSSGEEGNGQVPDGSPRGAWAGGPQRGEVPSKRGGREIGWGCRECSRGNGAGWVPSGWAGGPCDWEGGTTGKGCMGKGWGNKDARDVRSGLLSGCGEQGERRGEDSRCGLWRDTGGAGGQEAREAAGRGSVVWGASRACGGASGACGGVSGACDGADGGGGGACGGVPCGACGPCVPCCQ